MRFIILLFLSTLFFSAFTLADEMIVGSQAKPLNYSKLNKDQFVQLRMSCEGRGYISNLPVSYEDCVLHTSRGYFTQAAWDQCSSRSGGNDFLSCMLDYDGVDYPDNYISACAKIATVSGASSPKKCFDYLSKTQSQFNPKAFGLCLKIFKNNLEKSKDCLNSIRDREFDDKSLAQLTNCSTNIFPVDGFSRCWSEVTDQAPLRSSCAAPNAVKTPRSSRRAAAHVDSAQ